MKIGHQSRWLVHARFLNHPIISLPFDVHLHNYGLIKTQWVDIVRIAE